MSLPKIRSVEIYHFTHVYGDWRDIGELYIGSIYHTPCYKRNAYLLVSLPLKKFAEFIG